MGFGAAILSAVILNKILNIKSKSFFVVEMPNYKLPLLKNVGYTVLEKTKSFVFGAGKIILAISIILWFLGSNGFSDDFKNAEQIVTERVEKNGFSTYSEAYIKSKLQEYKSSTNVSILEQDNALSLAAMQDSLAIHTRELEERALNQEISKIRQMLSL